MIWLWYFIVSIHLVCAFQGTLKARGKWMLPAMSLNRHAGSLAVTSAAATRSKESTCGGCHLRHLIYKDQLTLKSCSVVTSLKEFNVIAPNVADIIPSTNELNYRNKAQFAIQRNHKGKKVVGLYELNTNIVTGNHICEIQHPLVNKVLQQFRTFLHHCSLNPFRLP